MEDKKIMEKIASYKTAMDTLMRLQIPTPTPEQEKLLEFFVNQFEVAFRCGFVEGFAEATRKEYVSSDMN